MSTEPAPEAKADSSSEHSVVNSVRIRPAQRKDLYHIVKLIADDDIAALREDLTDPLPREYTDAFDAIEADPRSALIVAVDGDEVLGTLQITYLPGLSRRGALRAQIEAVRVAKQIRGMGLGSKLFAHAIEEAQRHGCSLVQLTTDARRHDAQRFYKKLGFAETHAGMRLFLKP